MFDTAGPRLFALPCGADFPAHLVLGLQERLAGQPPQAMARVQLYVNTARMRRRVTDLLTASGAALLPRIHLITDLAKDAALPPAVPPLRRRLELAKVVAGLLQAQPDLAPRAALYDLSDSLAKLMDEMQGEGVLPEAISRLDVSNHSAHWSRTQRFLEIIAPYFADTTAPDAEARQRLAVLRLAAKWQAKPPADPVIVAGSTGSRGTTALLMQLVAGLPQGALVLPGFDTDLPAPVWDALAEPMTSEDHPQYRFRHLLDLMQLSPTDVRPWRDAPPPDAARNRLVSLALRPAPVTDQWLLEGPLLPDLLPATQGDHPAGSPLGADRGAVDCPDPAPSGGKRHHRRADLARPQSDAAGHGGAGPLEHPARRFCGAALGAVGSGAVLAACGGLVWRKADRRSAAGAAETSADGKRGRTWHASALYPRSGVETAPLWSGLSHPANPARLGGDPQG